MAPLWSLIFLVTARVWGQDTDGSGDSEGVANMLAGGPERGSHACEPDEFMCGHGGRCYSAFWRCDGSEDCEDGSDEDDCPRKTGGDCRNDHTEYKCPGQDLCIPRAFLCDGTFDCDDRADETGCFAPEVIRNPIPRASRQRGEELTLYCTFGGKPNPYYVWRYNWGHVPDPRRMKWVQDGTLTIKDIRCSDAGAYSCEALSNRGRRFAVDTILEVTGCDECTKGQYEDKNGECQRCPCNGMTCEATEGGVKYTHTRKTIIEENNFSGFDPEGQSNHWLFPSRYRNDQSGSYGGFIEYGFSYYLDESRGSSIPITNPDVVLKGPRCEYYYQSSDTFRASDRPYPNHHLNKVKVQILPENFKDVNNNQATEEGLRSCLRNVTVGLETQYDMIQRSMVFYNVTFDQEGREEVVGGVKCHCQPPYVGNNCENCQEGFEKENLGNGNFRCKPIDQPIIAPRVIWDGKYARRGDYVVADCFVENGDSSKLTWSRVSGRMPDGYVVENGRLMFDNMRPEYQGEYRCEYPGGYYKINWIYITLSVAIDPPGPTLITVPSVQAIVNGGVPPYRFRWEYINEPSITIQTGGTLYISNSFRPGRYRVFVTDARGNEASDDTDLLAIREFTVTVEPPRVWVYPGDLVNIRGLFDGSSIPDGAQTAWYFGGRRLDDQRGPDLYIQQVTDSQIGDYEFHVTYQGVTRRAIARVNPELECLVRIEPERGILSSIGTSVSMKCTVLEDKNLDRCKPVWRKKTEDGNEDVRGIISHTDRSTTHTIDSLGVQDAGTYQCVATNNLGRSNAQASEITVTVLALPRILSLETKRNGQFYSINCTADGVPAPTINILRDIQLNANMQDAVRGLGSGEVINEINGVITVRAPPRIERVVLDGREELALYGTGHGYVARRHITSGGNMFCVAQNPAGKTVVQVSTPRNDGVEDGLLASHLIRGSSGKRLFNRFRGGDVSLACNNPPNGRQYTLYAPDNSRIRSSNYGFVHKFPSSGRIATGDYTCVVLQGGKRYQEKLQLQMFAKPTIAVTSGRLQRGQTVKLYCNAPGARSIYWHDGHKGSEYMIDSFRGNEQLTCTVEYDDATRFKLDWSAQADRHLVGDSHSYISTANPRYLKPTITVASGRLQRGQAVKLYCNAPGARSISWHDGHIGSEYMIQALRGDEELVCTARYADGRRFDLSWTAHTKKQPTNNNHLYRATVRTMVQFSGRAVQLTCPRTSTGMIGPDGGARSLVPSGHWLAYTIQSATTADSGTYKCEGSSSQRIDLKVFDTPSHERKSNRLYIVAPGASAYRWSNGETGSSVNLDGVSRITCTVSYTYKGVTAFSTVLYESRYQDEPQDDAQRDVPKPKVRFDAKNPLVMFAGAKLRLRCESESPDTKLTIYRLQQEMKPRGTQSRMDTNSLTLKISGITVEDGGEYICEGTNSKGETSRASIMIRLIPRFRFF